MTESKKRIAIIGGGISGISCMWGLRETDLDIHLFESESRLGGHANSVDFNGNGRTVSVDTGFVAMHENFYPKFNAFLKALDVETMPTDMSFGVSADGGAFEWTSVSLSGFIGSIYNLFDLWFWRLLFDIVRFHFCATDIFHEHPVTPKCSKTSCLYKQNETVVAGSCEHTTRLESIGDYLHRHSYSNQFREYYIIPMGAAPRCIDPDEFARDFPAITFIQFMYDHGLLNTLFGPCHWRSFKNGSKTYVDAFLKSLSGNQHVHLETPIESLRRLRNGTISLITQDGEVKTFDHVVLAIHANQALQLLGDDATADEVEILRHFKTTRNVCYLHSDERLMPRRQTASSSWNVLMESPPYVQLSKEAGAKQKICANGNNSHPSKTEKFQKISITFDMNRLQGIPKPGELGSPGRALVSMNPIHHPKDVRNSFIYYHPLFTSDSELALQRLDLINGVRNISFAGAWIGYGFHEDGFKAGSRAAEIVLESSGIKEPGPVEKETQMNEIDVRWTLVDKICCMLIRGIQLFIV